MLLAWENSNDVVPVLKIDIKSSKLIKIFILACRTRFLMGNEKKIPFKTEHPNVCIYFYRFI